MKVNTLVMLFMVAFFFLFAISCKKVQPYDGIENILSQAAFIQGNQKYLNSPYVTAGDRLYVVGHQNGTFPELGWHVPGEMGGVWNHPIKLFDGWVVNIQSENINACLNAATTFKSFPFASQFYYPNIIPEVNVTQTQYVPDGQEAVNISYKIENNRSQSAVLQFSLTAYADLSPVWLGERTQMVDGPDFSTWSESTKAHIFKDSLNSWYAIMGGKNQTDSYKDINNNCQYNYKGLGTSAGIQYELEIPANDSINLFFTLAGSSNSEIDAIKNYEQAQASFIKSLKEKSDRYKDLEEAAKLTIPDKKIEQAFRWTKYNTDWLVRDVKGIGRGLGAGIPDYPWWFGVDNTYALRGAIAIGKKELVYETIDLLYTFSKKHNNNGRVVHEVSTNGAVFNPGNINETPQFATLIWHVFQWTGDLDFLKKYYPFIVEGLDWLMANADTDNNLLPDGFGIMEIHGLDSEMIDVASYTQEAFAAAEKMAALLKDEVNELKFQQIASEIKTKINNDFWVEDFNSFADFIGTPEEALHLIDDAIKRADSLSKPWAVKELEASKIKIAQLPNNEKRGFVLHHNWVVNTPMETGVADTVKALKALQTGSQFVNPFGVFVTGIDRDETAGTDDGSFAVQKKIFDYTGAVMTLPTGVQIIAENNYGRTDQALDYLKKLSNSFSYAFPGSTYEVSPDFGMITQAWTLYSYAIPIIEQFFGVKPDAFHNKIFISPQFPDEWENAALEHLIVGENILSIQLINNENDLKITITQSIPDVEIIFRLPENRFADIQINNSEIENSAANGTYNFSTTGESILLTAKKIYEK